MNDFGWMYAVPNNISILLFASVGRKIRRYAGNIGYLDTKFDLLLTLKTYRLEMHPLYAYDNALFIHKVTALRTTLNIDDELLQQARSLTGFNEKTALVREGLKALIERESARRLTKLGGSQPQLESIPRRRTDDAE